MTDVSDKSQNNKYLQALPIGSKLKDDYLIERVLGQGGFGITYKAKDLSLNTYVAIKEFFPNSMVIRDDADSVRSKTHDEDKDYQWALKKFIQEAQTLAQFRHDGIVSIYRVFEQNNTAYIVLEYVDGQDMEQWLLNNSTLPTQQELDNLLEKLLDALKLIHENDILHRDIKPANIYIKEDGSPVLLDFGAAYDTSSSKTLSSVAVASHGYSPYENYTLERDDRGPWTDIYSVSATLYRALTNKTPPDAISRIGDNDPYKPLVEIFSQSSDYRSGFLEAIDDGMSFHPQNRPQSIITWKKRFFEDKAFGGNKEDQTEIKQFAKKTPITNKKSIGFIGWASAAAVLIGVISMMAVGSDFFQPQNNLISSENIITEDQLIEAELSSLKRSIEKSPDLTKKPDLGDRVLKQDPSDEEFEVSVKFKEKEILNIQETPSSLDTNDTLTNLSPRTTDDEQKQNISNKQPNLDEKRKADLSLGSEKEQSIVSKDTPLNQDDSRLQNNALEKAKEIIRLAAIAKTKLEEIEKAKSVLQDERTNQTKSLNLFELTKNLQTELKRVGCYHKGIDGNWGPSSEQAMKDFSKHSNIKIASLSPNEASLNIIRQKQTQICPLICGINEVLENNKCKVIRCSDGSKPDDQGKCLKGVQNFDGKWLFTHISLEGCYNESGKSLLFIQSGKVSMKSDNVKRRGIVSQNGGINFSGPCRQGTCKVHFSGQINGQLGSGKYHTDSGKCRGNFKLKRL